VTEALLHHDRVGGERSAHDTVHVDVQDLARLAGGQVTGVTADCHAGVAELVIEAAVTGGT
jgi:hypothetical protein